MKEAIINKNIKDVSKENPLGSFEISQRNFVMARGVMLVVGLFFLILAWQFVPIEKDPTPAILLLLVVFIANAMLVVIGRNKSLSKLEVFFHLAFDVACVSVLVWLLGNDGSYFLVFYMVPVAVSAIALPLLLSFVLFVFVMTSMALAFLFLGYGLSMLAPIALFAFIPWYYLYKIGGDMRRRYEGLVATEAALAKEQRLAALGALSTAAAHELGTPLGTITLAAKEAMTHMDDDDPYREDMAVIAQEALRCREILKQLSSTHADEREDMLRRLPVEAMVQLAIDNHESHDREVVIKLQNENVSEQPMVSNKPEIVHGIGNFIENAVGFSNKTIEINIGWDEERLRISIIDDGPGFDQSVVDKLGNPYVSTRAKEEEVDETGAGGLGLGVFIAKTLIERTGGVVTFHNSMMGGAQIDIVWPRYVFDEIGENNEAAGGIPWELQ